MRSLDFNATLEICNEGEGLMCAFHFATFATFATFAI